MPFFFGLEITHHKQKRTRVKTKAFKFQLKWKVGKFSTSVMSAHQIFITLTLLHCLNNICEMSDYVNI